MKTIKTVGKLGLLGVALAAGGANAAGLIANTGDAGGSDLVLFVTNTVTSASFVQDLGVNTDSVKTVAAAQADNSSNTFYNASQEANGGAATLPGSLNVPSGLNFNSSALDSFLNSCSSNCQWTVLGTNPQTGGAQAMAFLTSTTAPALQTSVSGPLVTTGNTGSAALYLNSVFAKINTQTPDYTNNVSTTVGDGWRPLNSDDNSAGFAGLQSTGAGLGTSQTLYAFAGASNDQYSLANVYAGATQLSLSAASGLVASSGAPVPLPAAAWLLGSGLLGLAGIGRRRSTQVVAA